MVLQSIRSPVLFSRHSSTLAHDPVALRAQHAAPSFDMNKMTTLLDHDNHEMRREMREFMCSDLMVPKYNIPLLEERELALQRLQAVCDAGFISVLDFK